MKLLINPMLLCFACLLLNHTLSGQNLPEEVIHPGVLFSGSDSFYLSSPQWEKPLTQFINKEDTLNMGTHGYLGVEMMLWTDKDTIIIPHVNFPNRQLIKIPVKSPTDSSMVILRFQANSSAFSDTYLTENNDNIQIAMPETFELANIILYLSDCGKATRNSPNTTYSRRVREHFNPFLNHSLIKLLSNSCEMNHALNTYYGFRENSITFQFEGNRLMYNTPYKHVYGRHEINGGLFRNIIYLVQDFADKSNFRAFYKENISYYDSLVSRQSALLPLKKMWNWIENEFPNHIHSYVIYFSPLIGGSHSTQRFQKGFFSKPEFEECIMFINSPEYLDANREVDEDLKEAIQSGIVFTEIDHNYINPVSHQYIDEVNNLIIAPGKWASSTAQQRYSSKYAIFNEYMTHALFCLYITEQYDAKIAREVIDQRIKLMENRGFLLFREFNRIFLEDLSGREETIYERYGKLINEFDILN